MTAYKMKLYIAGASKEIDLARGYMADMRAAGYEITHDWCAVIDAHGGIANGPDVKDAAEVARENIGGVLSADILWVLTPKVATDSVGCWVELGAALMADRLIGPRSPKTIVLSGPQCRKSVFSALAHLTFASHTEAGAHLQKAHKAYVDIMLVTAGALSDDPTR